MAQLRKGTTYATGDQVTATNINALVDNAILLAGAINDQVAGSVASSDNLLLAGASDLKKATVSSLLTGLVKADGTVPMTADLPLVNSTPSVALSAASKGYVDSSISTAIPTGAIMPFYRSTAPAGWLECNGQSTTGYAALAALVGANVPDLRGEFIRGWAHDRTGVPDAGRLLGSYEADTLGSHTHTASSAAHTHTATDSGHTHTFTGTSHTHGITDNGHSHGFTTYARAAGSDGSGAITGGTDAGFNDGSYSGTTTSNATGISINSATAGGTNASGNASISVSSTAADVSIANTGGTETRPRNVAFMYCIKT